MTDFGHDFKTYLVARGIREIEDFKFEACSEHDIENARAAQGVGFLPRIYREFMLTMGYGAGNFLIGSDYTCNWLPDMKEAAKAIMELGSAQETLPPDAFVFFMHQGYAFWYFRTVDQEDDPPVFAYREGEPVSIKGSDHLSNWFYYIADQHTKS